MKRSVISTRWSKNAKQAAALVAIGGFLVLSLWLGDELWNVSAYWPASGIGFGATIGVLLPITFKAAERSFRMVHSDGSKHAPRWILAGTVYAAVALVSALAAARAIPGKGSGSCRSEWQPCWVNHLYPGTFIVTLGSLAATVAAMYWLPRGMSKLRVRSRR